MVRVMRDSPPDDARAFAGPDASTSSTRWPACRRCHAVQAPKTPAPTTIVSHSFAAARPRTAPVAVRARAPAACRISRRVTPSRGSCGRVMPSVRADQAAETVRLVRLDERAVGLAQARAARAAAAPAGRGVVEGLGQRALARIAQQVPEVVGSRA